MTNLQEFFIETTKTEKFQVKLQVSEGSFTTFTNYGSVNCEILDQGVFTKITDGTIKETSVEAFETLIKILKNRLLEKEDSIKTVINIALNTSLLSIQEQEEILGENVEIKTICGLQ